MVTLDYVDYGVGSSTATAIDCGTCDSNSTSGWANVRFNTGYKKIVLNCDNWADTDDWEIFRATPYAVTNASTAAFTCKEYNRALRAWTDNCTSAYLQWKLYPQHVPQKSPQERLREIIAHRQAPLVLVSRKPIQTAHDVREIRARETLLRVLGEDKFQKFIKDGFVSVRAKSGLVYQIFPGHGITAVYRDGVQVERLCVVLRGDFPPTDSLIMRYLIILNDENRFRGYAIKHQVIVKPTQKVIDERPLAEIFKELKEGRKVA
jgi:hypothetical protein